MGQIRNLQTDRLRGGAEQISYKVFNYEGTYQTTEDEDVLFSCPADLQPMYQDLTRQYERPLKKVEYITELSGNYFKNENAHFLFDDHRWGFQTLPFVSQPASNLSGGTYAGVFTDEDREAKALSGNKYAFTDVYTNLSTPLSFVTTEREYTKLGVDTEIKIEFDYYIHTTGTDEKYQIAIKAFSQETYNQSVHSGTPYSYDFANDSWSSGYAADKFKDFQTTTVNAWGKASVTLKPYLEAYSGYPNVDEICLSISVCFPKLSGGGTGDFESMAIDNFRISESYDVEDRIVSRRTQFSGNGTYTAEYKTDGNILSNEAKTTEYFIGKIEGNFKRPRDTVNKSLEQIITQDILNDNRKFLRKYEGTFRAMTEEFVGLHNKLWINFGDDILQEPVSCYIDAMKYDVKNAEYVMRLHVPNQDDDVGSFYNVYVE